MSTASAVQPILAINATEPVLDLVPPASPKTNRPRVWTVFVTWFATLIVGQLTSIAAFILVGLVAGIILGAQGANSATIQTRVQELFQMPLPALLLSLLPFQLGMAMVVLFAARRSKIPLKERLGLVPQSDRVISKLKLSTLAAFTIAAALGSFIFSGFFLGPPPANNPISNVIVDGSWLTITLLAIMLSVIPALVEETLFRGYIQRRLLDRWSPAVAIGVTSVLFAVMHMDSLQHIIAVLPLAIVTGLLAYRTKSIKPGMLVHGLHNVGAVAFGAATTALSPLASEETLGLAMIGLIVVLGLIGLPAVISLLRSTKAQPIVAALPEPEVDTEAVTVSLSVQSRKATLPAFAIDSRLAS